MAKHCLEVLFLLVSATRTLRVVVPKEMVQDHVDQDRHKLWKGKLTPFLSLTGMLTGLLNSSQAQAEVIAGKKEMLWGSDKASESA